MLKDQIKKIEREITDLQLSEKSKEQKKFEHAQNIEKIRKINNQIHNLEHDIFDLEASKTKIQNNTFNNKNTEKDSTKDKTSTNLKSSTMSLA